MLLAKLIFHLCFRQINIYSDNQDNIVTRLHIETLEPIVCDIAYNSSSR